jgi:hypothetical protein
MVPAATLAVDCTYGEHRQLDDESEHKRQHQCQRDRADCEKYVGYRDGNCSQRSRP